jgi:heme/copper-type cytochrome/quinol oxidase subunit 1
MPPILNLRGMTLMKMPLFVWMITAFVDCGDASATGYGVTVMLMD